MRRDADYYPTAPDAVEGLRLWLLRGQVECTRYYEPAAGYGAIMRGLQVDRTTIADQWLAAELQRDLAMRAGNYCNGGCRVVDSLEQHRRSVVAPPEELAIVMNPPFTLLDDFVRMALEYVAAGAVAIVLTRGQWLDEQGRGWLRRARLPDFALRLCWRVRFTYGKNGPSATHQWLVWLPGPAPTTTTTVWVERPILDERHAGLVADHKAFQPEGVVPQGQLTMEQS